MGERNSGDRRDRARRWIAALGLGLALGACNSRDAPPPPSVAPDRAAEVLSAPVHDAAPIDAAAHDAAARLAVDLDERTQQARRRFGASTPMRTVAGTFLLVQTGRPSPLFDKAAALLERALPLLFDGRFATHPDRAVTVLCFTDPGAYAAYRRAESPEALVDLGYYRRATRELAVDLSRGEAFLPTLTHEIVHPLLEADFPDAPLWLQEGIASLYEAPVFGTDGAIRGEPRNWRHAELQAALASRAERDGVQLDALFGMSARSFRGDPGHTPRERAEALERLHYALARSVCAWLDEQGKLWPFYRAWRDGVAGDETGGRAFERVMGGTPKAMGARWAGWAR